MSKQVSPSELAGIVSALLQRPEAMGELDDSDDYARFMQDIGQVVADYCGGFINGVSPPICYEAVDGDDLSHLHALSVGYDENLPDVNKNVWGHIDPDGFADADGFGCVDSVWLTERLSAVAAS